METVVKIPENNEFVTVSGVKINVVCNINPEHRWGVYFDRFTYRLPDGWNVCLKCAGQNLNVKIEENVKNESNNNK